MHISRTADSLGSGFFDGIIVVVGVDWKAIEYRPLYLFAVAFLLIRKRLSRTFF